MNCKFHPTAEAVTTCATCGAGMCSSCDAGAFARLGEREQPLCIECAFKKAEENVEFGKRYLRGMKAKRVFAIIFLLISIPFFCSVGANPGYFFGGLVFWVLAGLIQSWGHEKQKYSLKSNIWESINDTKKDEDEISFFGILIKIIFYILAAPVMLIRNFIDYSELKTEQDVNVQRYEEIKAAMDNAN